MPLTPHLLTKVKYAREADQYTKILLQWEGQGVHALLYSRRKGGLLAVLPPEAIPRETLDEARDGGYRGELGPYIFSTMEQDSEFDAGGTAPGKDTIELLFVDLKVSGAKKMEFLRTEDLSGDEMYFCNEDSEMVWPDATALRIPGESFLSQHGVPRVDGYVTAQSGEETQAEAKATTKASSSGVLVPKWGYLGGPPEPKADPAASSLEAMMKAVATDTRFMRQSMHAMEGRLSTLEKGKGPGLAGLTSQGVQMLQGPPGGVNFGRGKGLGAPSLLPSPPPRLGDPRVPPGAHPMEQAAPPAGALVDGGAAELFMTPEGEDVDGEAWDGEEA